MRSLTLVVILLMGCRDPGKETGSEDTEDPTDSRIDTQAEGADADGDGFASTEDCNDADPAIHPGAREICDLVDNDCDGLLDDEDPDLYGATTWYIDSDQDGFGGDLVSTEACDSPTGFVDNRGDCDDLDAASHPDADEICDGVDNNCDGRIDGPEASDALTWYEDGDGDGYGTTVSVETDCDAPAGYALHDGDCDDADPAYHPGAAEADCTDPADYNCDGSVGHADVDGDGFAACEDCDDADADVNDDGVETCDGLDNDCDGLIDSDDPDVTGTTVFFADADGDGHGGQQFQWSACSAPAGYVTSSDDCDDLDAASYPGASESCDGADNDCDGTVDEGVGSTWYQDADGDGYGNGSVSQESCDMPTGYVTNSQDCDDFSATTNPASFEVCDGVDNDCDGATDEDAINSTTWYVDGDLDGYGTLASATTACSQPSGYAANPSDCNDSDSAVSPAAVEFCDAVDNDCDGTVDEPEAADAATWFADVDGDGYGNASSTTAACSQPTGFVNDETDCDDTSITTHPGGTELCDGVDNNCDGTVDEDDAADAASWYIDSDGDGYGSTSTTVACNQPTGHVGNAADCNDGDGTVSPAASEVCDGVDNNCSGTVDDDLLGTESACPAQSCNAIVSAGLSIGDGTYWIDPLGTGAFEAWCDMTTDSGGWALSYIMCQDGGGDARAGGLSHATPITPSSQSPPTSLAFATVDAMAPSTIRFTSDFGSDPGYLFNWSDITSGVNHAQLLLDGSTSNINSCQSLGAPLGGSSGSSCSMTIEHNNGGSETHDIPTLGCSCAVWGSDGMKWGQIDSLSNYNGVSHLGSSNSWSHSPQTSDGCILVYVR